MDRIIILKSGTYNSAWFRAGHYYRLPEEFAQDLVDRGVAYYEGEDPPFDAQTVETWEEQFSVREQGAINAARLRAIRENRAEEARQRALENFERIKERAAALRANRGRN